MATHKRPENAYDLMRQMRGTDLTSNERAVLLAQYSYADPDGTNSRPSEETLAADLDISVSTIRRARKALRTKGWLIEKWRGRNYGEQGRASLYAVVIPSDAPAPEAKPKRERRNRTGKNQHGCRAGDGWSINDHSTGSPVTSQQEVKNEQNPSWLEVTRDHPPARPIDDHRRSSSSGGSELAGARKPGCPECGGSGGNRYDDHADDCSQNVWRRH